MALLSITRRKKYLKFLGYQIYNADSIKRFQAEYFTRPIDIDGIYGNDTDILLRHVYNVKSSGIKNFRPQEFRCPCGKCTGYPDRMKDKTLLFMQRIRDYYNKPVQVTSALRCKYENAQSGGVKNSKHLTGYAVDYYIKGVTDSKSGRKKHINIIKKWLNHDYSYGNGYDSNGYSRYSTSMGNAVHTQVK